MSISIYLSPRSEGYFDLSLMDKPKREWSNESAILPKIDAHCDPALKIDWKIYYRNGPTYGGPYPPLGSYYERNI